MQSMHAQHNTSFPPLFLFLLLAVMGTTCHPAHQGRGRLLKMPFGLIFHLWDNSANMFGLLAIRRRGWMERSRASHPTDSSPSSFACRPHLRWRARDAGRGAACDVTLRAAYTGTSVEQSMAPRLSIGDNFLVLTTNGWYSRSLTGYKSL